MNSEHITKATYDHEHNGKLYRFSPLSFKDQATLSRWAKFSEYRLLKSFQSEPPIASEKEALEKMWDRCWNKGKPTRADLNDLDSSDGIRQCFYYSLLHEHPTITLAEVEQLLTKEIIEEVMPAIRRMSFSEIGDDDEGREKKVAKKTTTTTVR